jgi:hypothetical protein
VTNDQLAAILAERVMRWSVGPDRFMMGDRRWKPRWKFQPATRMEDAFHLLEQAAPQEYALRATEDGGFWASVRIAGNTGEACASSQARAMTLAVARAFRLDIPEELEPSGRRPKHRGMQPARSKSDGV